MIVPYKFFIGGKVGSGKQWISWIHIKDAVRMIHYAIDDSSIKGPLNITAPHPKKMNDFGKKVGKILNRPHWLPVPSFALKILLGEMSVLVLEGQKVLPDKATKHGFTFLYPELEDALIQIYKK